MKQVSITAAITTSELVEADVLEGVVVAKKLTLPAYPRVGDQLFLEDAVIALQQPRKAVLTRAYEVYKVVWLTGTYDDGSTYDPVVCLKPYKDPTKVETDKTMPDADKEKLVSAGWAIMNVSPEYLNS